ncbi:hypothetical protein [Hyphococcus sp.]|uniref:hypothetical protein n=1 Tax=Hyphococcus sp. TaxID=2038636 RepID=UPI003D140DCF
MAKKNAKPSAIVGVAEHGNSAELVTVGPGGDLLDRRRVDLTHDLPAMPYHHEGAWAVGRYRDSEWSRDISLEEAVALIETVHKAADKGAEKILKALAKDVSAEISRIAIRECPPLPPTIEARIRDNRAQTVADGVMYRQAMAKAAEARGWQVVWYDKDAVFDQASKALGADIKPHLAAMGKTAGTPWQARHKLAAAAAIAAV